MNVGILLIATGKYIDFVPQMVKSLSFWQHDVKTFLFTDSLKKHHVNKQFYINKEPWPMPTLMRYEYFLKQENNLDTDYLYYVDVDARFVDTIDDEVIGDLVAVRHCGYYFKCDPPEETNHKSVFYGFPFEKYYGGGFQGGRREHFLNMSHWCRENIYTDLDNGVMPRFHDETAMNYYFNYIYEPTVELTPQYHYPEMSTQQSRDWFINNRWEGNDFKPKLLLLDKNHDEVRR